MSQRSGPSYTSVRDVSKQARRPAVPRHPTRTVIFPESPPNLEMYVLTQSREHFSAKSPNHWWSRWKEPEGAMIRSHETFPTRVILTIVKANICSTPSQNLFPTKETESIQPVIEVDVDNRFAKLDRTLCNGATVIGRSVTDGESTTIEPLAATGQKLSDNVSQLHKHSR